MQSTWNKILKIDLTNGTFKNEQLSEEIYQKFLGGAGIVAYILWRECPRRTTAFDPSNRLIFAAGPLQGVRQTGAAKWAGGTISPMINMNFDSAATASFGIEMKRAGYDAIIVHGRAKNPVFLLVDDDHVEIKDASHVWGRNAFETEDILKGKEGDGFECLTIGRAAEKLVRFANIQTKSKSFLGRGGLGAVMGSKFLKGISLRGSQSISVHDLKGLNGLNKEINDRLAKLDRAKPFLLRCTTAGTARAVDRLAPQGNLPIKNQQQGSFPSGIKNLKTSNYVEKLSAKPWPCKYCVIMCHNKCIVQEGPYAFKGKGPEYETLAMMGLNTLIDDIEAIAYAAHLADDFSMDTISLGGVIAWALECYEKNIIKQEDSGGLDLSWGNAKAMVELVRRIGERIDGLPYLLGEGMRIASEKLGQGSENWALQMKGQEIAAHQVRAQYISALNYCTGVASGPNHERGNSQHLWASSLRLPEWGIGEVSNEERWSWEKAAERNAKLHDYANVVNSACHCKFMEYNGYTLTDLLKTINACTGLGWTQEDLRRCGERITNLQKLLNIRYGWTKEADFKYPKRFMEPVDEGPAAGKMPIGLEAAIMDYYKERGWNDEGKPTREKLKDLDLESFVD